MKAAFFGFWHSCCQPVLDTKMFSLPYYADAKDSTIENSTTLCNHYAKLTTSSMMEQFNSLTRNPLTFFTITKTVVLLWRLMFSVKTSMPLCVKSQYLLDNKTKCIFLKCYTTICVYVPASQELYLQLTWLVVTEVQSKSFGSVTECRH